MQMMFQTITVSPCRTLADGRRETSVSLATATIKRNQIKEKPKADNLRCIQFSVARRAFPDLSISVMSLNPAQTL